MNVTTLILAGGRGSRLYPLTRRTNKAAIRFGGIYRIIDFTLSNCLNSGIRKIFVLTQYASTSLERHIKVGWNSLFRAELDEFVETRPPQYWHNDEGYHGTANAVFQNLDVIQGNGSDAVLILSGDHIYKMDYRKMIAYHLQTKADMTIACVDQPLDVARSLGVLSVGNDYRVNAFTEKPDNPVPKPDDPTKALCSMGVYLFHWDCLQEALTLDAENPHSGHDFGRDIVPLLVSRGAKIQASLFVDENKKESKYWRDIGTVDSYYEASIDLVSVDPQFNLYDKNWQVRAFIPQLPPAKSVFNTTETGRIGAAFDSLVSPGVILGGGSATRSILSPGVFISSWATVENSILFDNVKVGRNSIIRNAIVDHNVTLPAGTRIGIDPEEDQKRYAVSPKGIIVVTE